MEQEKIFRHICTAGLEKEIIFKTDTDYIFGMNSIPVCMADKDISMHAFCLMDNYVNKLSDGQLCKQIIPKKLLYIAKNKYNMHLITLSRFSKELFFTLLFS